MATAAPACKKALSDATQRWPTRNKTFDGIMGDARHQKTKSDHNDGNAVDVTHDPDVGCSGDVIAAAAIEDSRVKYVIWNRRIYDRRKDSVWRAYKGKNPHTKHCHISILASAREDTRPWGWAESSISKNPATPKAAINPEMLKATADATAVANQHGVAAALGSANVLTPDPTPGPAAAPPPPPAPIPQHPYPGVPLQMGSRGRQVTTVQYQLKGLGWELTIDGIFGPLTRRLVIRFQERRSLLGDGVVGPRTWKSLFQ